MSRALTRAHSVIKRWLADHPDCFPPIVINISDGEPTDGDPSNLAKNLQQLTSSDGNILLFNVHLSSQNATPIEYPDHEEGLPDKHARLLFRMSSSLPEYMRTFAHQAGFTVSENSRGFVFNADIVSVIQFLDIGTRPSNLR